MSAYKLPQPAELNESLEMILGGPAKITPCDALSTNSASHAAEFRNRQDEVVAYCLCDLPIAAGLGAALSMVPPGAAEDMIEEGVLTEMASANLYEVMNIFSALYMDDSTAHLKLTTVEAANDAGVSLEGETQEVTFNLDTGKYGQGKVRFISK
ncbi:MAG: hypothetical protein ACPGSC_01935 [Granulosicoccaceae bacterium]